MARKSEPGISYYPMRIEHTANSKIRLLFNEFGSDGYWIWSCILTKIYGDKGYYMDASDEDALELFATDVCKKKVSLVKEVITGCVRRGLFDKAVFDKFGILTSDRIQENYLEATKERRRKDTEITMKGEYLVITEDENWKNIIITRNNSILPRNNEVIPRNNPQSKVEESKEDKRKVSTAAPAPRQSKKETEPYWEALVEAWFCFYETKFSARPTLNGAKAKSLKTIISNLKKLTEGRERRNGGVIVWDEIYAIKALNYFLTKAWEHDEWLRQNFELSNLVSKYDSITNSKKVSNNANIKGNPESIFGSNKKQSDYATGF